jgi:hypothetical protein
MPGIRIAIALVELELTKCSWNGIRIDETGLTTCLVDAAVDMDIRNPYLS